LAKVWADAAYKAMDVWVAGHCRWVLDIVTKRPGQRAFEVQKWRWVVERTFGWFGRYRRLSKDYEHSPKSSEAWIYIAMIHRMSRFELPLTSDVAIVNQKRDGGHVQIFRKGAGEVEDPPVVLLGCLFFVQRSPAAFGGDDAVAGDSPPVQGL